MSFCKHGWDRDNYVKCPRCYDDAQHAEEIARLNAQVTALQGEVVRELKNTLSAQASRDEYGQRYEGERLRRLAAEARLASCNQAAEENASIARSYLGRAESAEAQNAALRAALLGVMPFAEAAVEEAAGWSGKDEQAGRAALALAGAALDGGKGEGP